MLKDVFKEYRENFFKFTIYFILSVILKIISSKLSLSFADSWSLNLTIDFSLFLNKEFFLIILLSLVEIYVFIYGLIISRNIIVLAPISQKEAFTEASSYYPKMVIINFVFSFLLIVALLGLQFLIKIVPFNFLILGLYTIFFVIFISLISVFMSTIENCIVYYDEKVFFLIKEGIEIGKGHFFKILGILLIGSVFDKILSSNLFKVGGMDLYLDDIFNSLYSIYLSLYVMSIIKKRGRVSL